MVKKLLVACMLVLAFLIVALFSIVFFVDYNLAFKNYLSNSTLKIDPTNVSKITVYKFPIPYITIDNIKKENTLDLQNIELKFSLISLIKFKPKIKALKISKANINLAHVDCSVTNHDLFIANLITNDAFNVNMEIDSLYFLTQNNTIVTRINDFALYKSDNKLNEHHFQGNIVNLGNFSGSFDKDKDNVVNFKLDIVNNYYNLKLSEHYKDAKLSYGKGELKIIDFSVFMTNYFSDFSGIFKKIKTDEIVEVKYDLIPLKDDLQLKNLTINSDSISGKGKVDISKNDDVSSVITLDFSNIDIKSLVNPKDISQIDIKSLVNSNNINQVQSGKSFSSKYSKIKFPSLIDSNLVNINISIDKVILNNTESLNKVKFISNVEGNVFSIKDFSGLIESGGGFKVSGNVTDNSFRKVFDGNIYLKHGNLNQVLDIVGYQNASVETITPFILSSDLKFTLIDLYLYNLLLRTNKAKITGAISSKFIGSTPRIGVFLDFSSLDIGTTEYPIISPIIGFAKSLIEDMKTKEYLNKFIPIRTLLYLGNFDLTFNDLMFNSKPIGQLTLSANLSQNNIKIDNLDINSGPHFLFTSWNLETNGIKPKLNIKISDGALNVNFLTPSSWLDLRNKLYNDFSLDKVLVKLDCNMSTLYQNDIKLDNLKFSLNNDSTLLNIANLDVGIFSGNLKGSGSILLEPHTVNFAYALNSIDLTNLSNALPKGLIEGGGNASINGMFTTTGDTLPKLLYNFYTRSTLIAKNLKVQRFGIDTFIEKIASKTYDLQNIKTDLKNSINKGTTDISTLNTNIEITKGILSLKDMTFQTKYISAAAAAGINIYDFSVNWVSIFSFYPVGKMVTQNSKNSKDIVKIGLKATGSMFDPQKTVDSDDLMAFLKIGSNDAGN